MQNTKTDQREGDDNIGIAPLLFVSPPLQSEKHHCRHQEAQGGPNPIELQPPSTLRPSIFYRGVIRPREYDRDHGDCADLELGVKRIPSLPMVLICSLQEDLCLNTHSVGIKQG